MIVHNNTTGVDRVRRCLNHNHMYVFEEKHVCEWQVSVCGKTLMLIIGTLTLRVACAG